jgi:hypothetical protein
MPSRANVYASPIVDGAGARDHFCLRGKVSLLDARPEPRQHSV